jgi:hypothetical protein
MRQLDRLNEPDEMALFRRYKALGPTRVMSTYGPLGPLDRKVAVPSSNFRAVWGLRPSDNVETTLTLLQCETVIASIERHAEAERLLSRRVARLGEAYADTPLADIPVGLVDRLRLSNAAFSRQFPGGPTATRSGNGSAAAGGGGAMGGT